MEKRLNRSDYLFSLVFVFMLVCIAGAFFYGMELGKSRTAAQYEELLARREEALRPPGAYDQQHLVSFYYTVFGPYREFANKWFDKLSELERGTSDEASATMKELAKLAGDKFKEASTTAAPSLSPMLVEAQQNMLKSLKLFADTADKYVSRAGSARPAVLLADIEGDAYMTEAKKFALLGQKLYYLSILKWNESVDPTVAASSLPDTASLTIDAWSRQSLNAKNAAVAALFHEGARFTPLYPQDMTVRIDEMLQSGQAGKLQLTDISSIVSLLLDTNAARKGDFIARKDWLYSEETMPQLPFFYENK